MRSEFNLLSDPSSLMFPTIDDRKVYDVRLASEDIKAIQKLYGRKTKKGSEGKGGTTSLKLKELYSTLTNHRINCERGTPFRKSLLQRLF